MAAAYLGRLSLRGRWRGYAGIALLLGLTVGLGLFAIAGARRTQSAFPRFLRSVHAGAMAVTSDGIFNAETNARIARLPEVVQTRTYVSFQTAVLVNGAPDFTQDFEASGTFDGEYFDQDRFTATHGRVPDRLRAGEVAVNEHAAQRYGYRVGEHLDLATYSFEQFTAPGFFAHPPPPSLRTRVQIVGIGVFPDEVLQDDADRTPRVLLTPAYSEVAKPYVNYGVQSLVLRHGDADVDPVRHRLGAPGAVEFQVTSVGAFHALQAVRPLSLALGIFGIVAAAAGLVLVAQGLIRLIRLDRDSRAVLRAVGATPSTITRVALTAPTLTILAGVALALVLAVVASPAAPIGPMRRVEVASGFAVDGAVMAVGALVAVAVLVTVAVVAVWYELPHRRRVGTSSAHRSRLVAAAAGAGLAPSAVEGLRFAFERGSDANPVRARTVMTGAAIAITALVAALTFGASLDTLLHAPRLYGWNWDVALVSGDGYDNIVVADARKILAADPDVAAWSGAHFASADAIDGLDVPILGMDPGSAVLPPILRGRAIRRGSEIVLGAATAARLHKRIGDEVTLGTGSTARRLEIVGIATFPTIGILHATHTSLGVGALVVPELVPGFEFNITGEHVGPLGPNAIFVRYRPGTDRRAALARLTRAVQPLAGFAGIDVVTVQRPAEIVNSSSIGDAPLFLALALALGAMVSLALALGTSVRRRRRDLALLKTLGFTPRQVAATVAWHATTTIVVGLLIGVPLGAVLGRGLWYLFAGQLDVVTRATVPVLALLGVVLVALGVANAAAAIPARAARRVDPSRVLHSQ